MGLSVRLIRDLSEIVDPVVEFLSVDTTQRGIFDTDHLIVPTAGVKAWLNSELVKRLGITAGKTDGVIANVEIGYIGGLTRFVAPTRFDDDDAWSIDHVTMLILHYISGREEFAHLAKRHGGTFAAARHLADRFDRYHARRSRMISLWEESNPSLTPTTRDALIDGERVVQPLGDQLWQYEIWRNVRDQIGVSTWSTRIAEIVRDLRSGHVMSTIPSRLMVAGLQSLSLNAIDLLMALGEVSDIEVLLVHPSPGLAETWHSEFATVDVTPGILSERDPDISIPPSADPLVASWLRSSRELQQVMASQGLVYSLHQAPTSSNSSLLLHRMKDAIAAGTVSEVQELDTHDLSVQIHRCYNVTRQVEVLHESLIHAFTELPDLQPHEVVIYSPQINQVASILDAVFARPILTGDGKEILIPLRVADRSLRDVSDDVELLANVLELMTSRFPVARVIDVATSKPVMQHLGIAEDQMEIWTRSIERTKVRWGLDATERRANGLDADGQHAHTWQQAIERTLLGATLSDGPASIELGGVVPLSDVGTDEIEHLLSLITIFDALVALDRLSHSADGITKGAKHSVVEWCNAVERLLLALCGDESTISEALDELTKLKRATSIPLADGAELLVETGITFADFARVALDRLGGSASHAPLRSGAVTATSFVPLRGVPFRVACVIGLDDGVISNGESESDDIASLQQIIGDDDPRIDGRRQFLDAVMSTEERLIITCNGRSITNNAPIPLTTALSEFVDFAVRLGVGRIDDVSEIEYSHPRHHNSSRNFIEGGIMSGRVWSHDNVAQQSAVRVGRDRSIVVVPSAEIRSEPSQTIDIVDLTRFYNQPLNEFVGNTMSIRRYIEVIEETPAVLPLDIESDDYAKMVIDLIEGSASAEFDRDSYVRTIRDSGTLPVGVYGDMAIAEIIELATSFASELSKKSVPVTNPPNLSVACDLPTGVRVTANIDRHHAEKQVISHLRVDRNYKFDLEVVAMQLMLLATSDAATRTGHAVHVHSKTPNLAQMRTVELGDSIDVAEALHRLETLENLKRRAQTYPFPRFGDTVKALFSKPPGLNVADARKKFHDFVNGSTYIASSEAIVYGREPRFEEIFDADGVIVRFWTELNSAAPFGAGGVAKEHLKSKKYVVG